jgi:Tfp pilus assembly protein PilO
MIEFLKGRVTPQDWMIVSGIVIVAALVCAAGYFLLYLPEQEKHVALNEDLKKVEADLKKARQYEADIDELRVEAQMWEELVTSFERRLPDEREIPQLMRKFELLGDEIGLRVQLAQLPTTTDTRKETIPYEVTAYGDFHQIMSFINLLERHNRYLKISELDIQEQEAGVSEASFTLSTFRFIKKAVETAPAAGGAAS